MFWGQYAVLFAFFYASDVTACVFFFTMSLILCNFAGLKCVGDFG